MPQASAATASSSWGAYGPVHGYRYENLAAVTTTSSRVYAVTEAYNAGSGNVPTGYIGVLARLYKGSALCASNGYTYNTAPMPGWSIPTQGNGCGSGTYHSYGVSQAFNGSSYNAFYTFVSPSLVHGAVVTADAGTPTAAPGRNSAGPTWARNATGLTYGSGMEATEPENEPDLMQAYATNGRLGYVKRTDLESEPTPASPRQAVATQSRLAGQARTLTVYALDGTTPVGDFVITHNQGHAPAPSR
ncbi:ATP-dependent Lon protease [Streptomyces sp. V4-01]|uniref:ATP-dependent Lon protease n=1 Tax=Actinacidiphila polyblastidii TaxID=3110430 RepID=A0ABU7P3F8_9ACTN|nr:ATP-dependent Lon protease [Streptomyces sp. V4-01]